MKKGGRQILVAYLDTTGFIKTKHTVIIINSNNNNNNNGRSVTSDSDYFYAFVKLEW